MRIIAGIAKGKKLLAPAGNEITRPTADKVREAIFGSIQFEIANSSVLDLFAGSGALGIEALSRQAANAVFVDQSKEAITVIHKNLENTGMRNKAEVLHMDFHRALSKLQNRFDFIFLDPPYKAKLYQPAMQLIRQRALLAENGLLIIEHDGNTNFDGENVLKIKQYGKTFVTYIGGMQR